ncbi:hypothetical protein D3C76_962740 [compost metagenome]
MAMPMPMAHARMPMKLAFISALTGLSTTLSSRLCSTSPIPPGAVTATSWVDSTRLDGNIMLATTATTAAAKVPSRYRNRIGRMWVSWPCLWLAIDAMTSTNTRIGATAFRALTKTLPINAVDLAVSGAIKARAIPAIRPITICVTRLRRFRRCKREGDEAVIKRHLGFL